MADDVESGGVRGARTARKSRTQAPQGRRGRPRTVAPELSPSDRAQAWQEEWARIGGHRTTVNLSPAAWEALQALAGKRERSALIERLILREQRERGRK